MTPLLYGHLDHLSALTLLIGLQEAHLPVKILHSQSPKVLVCMTYGQLI